MDPRNDNTDGTYVSSQIIALTRGKIATCEERACHAYLQPSLECLLTHNPVPVLASQQRSASARQGPTTCSSLSFDILRGVPDSLPILFGDREAERVFASRLSGADH